MRVRAIASDYDETLARAGKVSEQTCARLSGARRAGVKIVLITGRRVPELVEVFDQIALVDLVVAENGGYCYSPHSKVGWRIAPAADQELIVRMREGGVEPLSVGETIIGTLTSQIARVEAAVAGQPAAANAYDLIRNRESLMVLPRGTDKGSGLREAMRFLRIPLQNTVAVGDAENDLPLLAAAGHGVAVGDAIQILKQSADATTLGSGPDGVIELFDDLAANGWEQHKRGQAQAG